MLADPRFLGCLRQFGAVIPATVYTDLAYITAAVLVPLVPAYILYKCLPAQASVSGVLSKFNVKLSGAFAGYFALVLVVFGFVQSLAKERVEVLKETPKYEVYSVKGVLDLGEFHDFEHVRLSLWPPDRPVEPNGKFQFEVTAKPDQQGEKIFPTLVIEHPDFEPATVDLDPSEAGAAVPSSIGPQYHVEVQKDSKTVRIRDRIALRKKDPHPYNPDPRVIDSRKEPS